MSYHFELINKKLYIIYTPEFGSDWLLRKLKIGKWKDPVVKIFQDSETINIRKTFYIPASNHYSQYKQHDELEDYEEDEKNETFAFEIGRLIDDEKYIQIDKEVLGIRYNLYIDKTIKLDSHFFGKYKVSVFYEIGKVYKNSRLFVEKIQVDDQNQEHISENDIRLLADKIPNSYEIDLYKKNRISSYVEDFLNVESYKPKLEAYVSKRHDLSDKKVEKAYDELFEFDVKKFQYLKDKLEFMLKNSEKFLESAWQKEILTIFRFIYPQYVYVEEKLILQSISDDKKLETDIVLIDTDGNIDLIEIKRPDEFIQYKSDYRNNYIPSKNLIGTCMQLQNYLNCLIRTPQKELEKFRQERALSKDIVLKVNSPKGFIIFGRDNYITSDEKRKMNFFTTRRMFANIVDIITYDELIRRLNNIIISLKNKV